MLLAHVPRAAARGYAGIVFLSQHRLFASFLTSPGWTKTTPLIERMGRAPEDAIAQMHEILSAPYYLMGATGIPQTPIPFARAMRSSAVYSKGASGVATAQPRPSIHAPRSSPSAVQVATML
jgi:hypothetical protein